MTILAKKKKLRRISVTTFCNTRETAFTSRARVQRSPWLVRYLVGSTTVSYMFTPIRGTMIPSISSFWASTVFQMVFHSSSNLLRISLSRPSISPTCTHLVPLIDHRAQFFQIDILRSHVAFGKILGFNWSPLNRITLVGIPQLTEGFSLVRSCVAPPRSDGSSLPCWRSSRRCLLSSAWSRFLSKKGVADICFSFLFSTASFLISCTWIYTCCCICRNCPP